MILRPFLPLRNSPIRALLIFALVCALLQWSAQPVAAAYSFDLVGPAGSGKFGSIVIVLPNGNLVITDPFYDKGAITDVGAVYLYNGVTHALISTLTGSKANDRVGYFGVKVLNNGNYVIQSPYWINGSATNAGAATWGSMDTGVSGVVSALNSLVGSSAADYVGVNVIPLTNGNYVVASSGWDAPDPVADVGAVTWGNGATGIKGQVSSLNSLVGSTADDKVGGGGVTPLLVNGNYVVRSPYWDGGAADVGAATWVNGATGQPKGAVSDINSLVGSTAFDYVGTTAIALTNGNYVVGSEYWDGSELETGAATWVNGATGTPKGAVSDSNSLVGSSANDNIGYQLKALTNGNYVVQSPYWDGSAMEVGAATFGNGLTGQPVGAVTSANSLVGSTADDNVGLYVTALLVNGNYVVRSPYWDNGAADVGAATWVNGITGQPKGAVTSSNSLVGSTLSDWVGSDAIALTNGNYVVQSSYWNSVGAATWVNGSTGQPKGAVSSGNSLVGSTFDDQVGVRAVSLANGNYVVGSYQWDGTAVDTGAATWGDGDTGITGPVSASNSLVGNTAYDCVGEVLFPLTNGNYVVGSPYWNNSASGVGAITWGDGDSGITGMVSSSNSLVGSTADDKVGIGIIPIPIGDYLAWSLYYDYGGTLDSGAVTWGTAGTAGPITGENSVRGLAASGGVLLRPAYNAKYVYLAVGRPAENLVTLFWLSRDFLPVIKK